jgi:hypothetical protein
MDATKLAELKARARASIAQHAAEALAAQPKLDVLSIPPIKLGAGALMDSRPDCFIMDDLVPTESPEDKLIRQYFESRGLEQNPEQTAYIKLILSGKNCILIGAAGTGKTTVQGIAAEIMEEAGKLGMMRESTKYLLSGTPGVAIISFTNKAVNNIRWKMPEALRANCITGHKLLEFGPIWYEVEDPTEPGTFKKTMRFEPSKNKFNPLPSSLKLLVLEEGSMFSTELYAKTMDAIPHDIQVVILGDIHQLPPVYGTAILGYKMLEWPIIELTKIFRQAAESPIISFAWDIKNGKTLDSTRIPDGKRIKVPSFDARHVENKLTIKPWQKKLSELEALFTATAFLNKLHDAEEYNPDEDIILIPFNKRFGSIELNNGIAQHLGDKRGAIVHEIIAGFKKLYLAVGDKVMYQKEDCYIEDIVPNAEYLGKPFQKPSKTLDRWGQQQVAAESGYADSVDSIEAMDKFLAAAVKDIDDEDRTTVASHTVILKRSADGIELELDTAGEVNNIIGGYCITVHKAQGSEWRKVFLILHHTHSAMVSRELLYTAVTRAKESLYILCEPTSFEKGVLTQRIKGNTLAEKAEYFKGKKQEMEEDLLAQDETLTISPIKIKVADLVDDETKKKAQDSLLYHWKVAAALFGPKLGPCPVLDFNLYRKNTIGLAHYVKAMIKLNPVYLAAKDEELTAHMLTDTIIHEICHFAAKRVFKEGGHGYYWKHCMHKMNVPAHRICPVPVPQYMEAKIKLVNERFEMLRGQRDITPVEEGEQE